MAKVYTDEEIAYSKRKNKDKIDYDYQKLYERATKQVKNQKLTIIRMQQQIDRLEAKLSSAQFSALENYNDSQVRRLQQDEPINLERL